MYVKICQVCHVVWKNDFPRHVFQDGRPYFSMQPPTFAWYVSIWDIGVFDVKPRNRLNGKRGEYMIWDKNRVLSMRRVWVSGQQLIRLTSSGHPKKAFVLGAGCMFVQPLNVSSSGPVAGWKQSRWIWVVRCSSEDQNPDCLSGIRSLPHCSSHFWTFAFPGSNSWNT